MFGAVTPEVLGVDPSLGWEGQAVLHSDDRYPVFHSKFGEAFAF